MHIYDVCYYSSNTGKGGERGRVRIDKQIINDTHHVCRS